MKSHYHWVPSVCSQHNLDTGENAKKSKHNLCLSENHSSTYSFYWVQMKHKDFLSGVLKPDMEE